MASRYYLVIELDKKSIDLDLYPVATVDRIDQNAYGSDLSLRDVQ